MKARADQVAANDQKILDAAAELWLKLPLSEVTLEKVAEQSGFSIRTLLRKFGSREGLMEACVEQDAGDFLKKRREAPVGDPEGILDSLLSEYEQMGDAVIRALMAEEELPVAKKLLETGRNFHKEWCATVFAPFLPSNSAEDYEERLHAFMAATEIYLWKMLRRDHNRSYEQTFQVFQQLLEGLIANGKN